MRPNQIWSTDITYIRLAGGFAYWVAIIIVRLMQVVAAFFVERDIKPADFVLLLDPQA